MRAAVPPTPRGITLRTFGRDVMRWGTGDNEAKARIATLTRDELIAAGMTRDIAEAWRDFYRHEARRVSNNPSVAGRADLMQRAVDLLS